MAQNTIVSFFSKRHRVSSSSGSESNTPKTKAQRTDDREMNLDKSEKPEEVFKSNNSDEVRDTSMISDMAETAEPEEVLSPAEKRLFKRLDTLAKQDDLSDVKNSIRCIQNTLIETKEHVLLMQNEISTLSLRVEETNRSLEHSQMDIDDLKERNKALTSKVGILERDSVLYAYENTLMKKKLAQLENYSRRENLIFEGIRESKDENTMTLIQDILANKLGLKTEDIRFHEVHRLGTRSFASVTAGQGKPRAIIARFLCRQDRMNVWALKKHLKGTDIWIREDLPEVIERQRRFMYAVSKMAKDNKFPGEVYVSGPSLVVNKKRYAYEELDKLPDAIHPRRLCTREVNGHILFYGKYSPLSNFHQSPFVVDDHKYQSVEEYYQTAKAIEAGDDIARLRIRKTADPVEQKRIGGSIKINELEWQTGKGKAAMTKAVTEKFRQNPRLKQFLLETEDRPLVECNVGDRFWSCGLSIRNPHAADQTKWQGNNWLGQCLMEVRQSLK